MEGFDLVTEASVSGVQASFWQSQLTGQALLIAQAPTPAVNVAIVIPTKAENSEGEPHCLEHLIFRGSEKYPVAGFIDSLASKSLSAGTNAFTCTDRTVYTVSVAGDEGLCQILPVYLDHIHHPLLLEKEFATEVYRVDSSGDNTGVVYSEMEADMSDPESIANMALQRLAYSADCSYHHMTGGHPSEIPKLTNSKVRAMHSKYYKPSNTVIVIVGQVDPVKICNCLRQYEASLPVSEQSPRPFVSPWAELVTPPELPPVQSVSMTWPSDAEEGLCALAFRTGCWTDLEERLAVDVLATYLSEGPAAPLNEFIIETPDQPLASSVSHVIEDYRWTMTSFYFEDAIVESMEMIKPRFLEIVASLINNGDKCKIDFDRLRSIIQKKIWEEYSTIEQCQLDYRLSSWIINSTRKDMLKSDNLRNAVCQDQVYEQLLSKDSDYWKAILHKFFSGSETAPCYEALIRPDSNLSDAIELTKKRLRETRIANNQIPPQPRADEKARKQKLADMMDKHGKAILNVDRVNLVVGEVYKHESEWECSKELSKIANPLHLVDMEISREGRIVFESKFVDMSILVHLPKEWGTQTLWAYLNHGGKRSLLNDYDTDIKSFLQQLSRTDMEKKWKTKEALLAKESENLGVEEKVGDGEMKGDGETSSFESESEAEDSLEDFCEQSLWFVLSQMTCAQMVHLMSHCYFNSHLAMPKSVAKRLALDWTECQNDIVLIEPAELNKKLTAVALEFDADQGLDSSAIFNSLLHINWKTHTAMFAESLPLLKAVLEYTELSLERLLVAAKKDLTHYNSMIRAGSPLLSSVSHLTKYKFESAVNMKNVMVQSVLSRVALKYPEVFQEIIQSLMEDLKDVIFSNRAMLHVAANARKFCSDHLPPLLHNFGKWASNGKTIPPEKQQPIPIKSYTAQKLDKLPKDLTINNLHTVTLESGHLHVTCPLPSSVTSKYTTPFGLYTEGAFLLVVLEFLRGLEGPVFQPVRDSGTCYGPSFRICLDQLTQTLSLSECTKPHEALDCAMQSLNTLQQNTRLILQGVTDCAMPTLQQFEQAKSAALHEAVDELATPADSADAFLDCWLRRIPGKNDILMLRRIEQVTFEEFLKTLDAMLSSFLNFKDSQEKLVTAVGPKDKSDEVGVVITKWTSGFSESQKMRSRLVDILLSAVKEDPKEKPFLKMSLENLMAAQISSLCDELEDDDEDDDSDDGDMEIL